jgi:hypothetical protein
LGERLLCKQEVIGSIPFTSTISRNAAYGAPTAVTELPREGVVAHHGWPLKAIVEAQFACNAPALPACSLTGEESVTEAGVSFAFCCSPVAGGGRGCSSAFEVECLHEEASRTGAEMFVLDR